MKKLLSVACGILFATSLSAYTFEKYTDETGTTPVVKVRKVIAEKVVPESKIEEGELTLEVASLTAERTHCENIVIIYTAKAAAIQKDIDAINALK